MSGGIATAIPVEGTVMKSCDIRRIMSGQQRLSICGYLNALHSYRSMKGMCKAEVWAGN
jgi:hypothetical protein